MIETVLYYFTATGNSLAVARGIASRLGDTKLIHMADKKSSALSPVVKRVGIVFPVYIFGLPLIVSRFIDTIRIPPNTYVFAVATHGGMPCAALKQASDLFAKRGISLSSGFAILMVDNATQMKDIISSDEQNERFLKAELLMNDICAKIQNDAKYIFPGWPLVNWLFSKIYYKAIPDLPGFDKNFSVDLNCNGCGVCEKVCPMNNIEIIKERPSWRHHCEQCLACFHWCPKTAIQYGDKTAGRSRYHHPNIKTNDIIARNG